MRGQAADLAGSKWVVVGVGLLEDGQDHAAVDAEGTEETSRRAQDLAGSTTDDGVVVAGGVFDQGVFEDQGALDCDQRG